MSAYSCKHFVSVREAGRHQQLGQAAEGTRGCVWHRQGAGRWRGEGAHSHRGSQSLHAPFPVRVSLGRYIHSCCRMMQRDYMTGRTRVSMWAGRVARQLRPQHSCGCYTVSALPRRAAAAPQRHTPPLRGVRCQTCDCHNSASVGGAADTRQLGHAHIGR